ncbi:MAG TPA: pyruvate kinase, partial [Vicinamibacterales bacterium]|nr:pyruvate kinase [Vicinamibacterales bacterium]
PDTEIQAPALTAKDLDDLAAGVAMGVDLVAQSFVQSAADVRAARAAAARAGAPDLPIIAKIERPQAVEGIDAILDEADGILVARGDLGIELPLETLPAVQRRLVTAARRRGVPVIVATEVLESMRTEPRPTRAEVTDAAHAVDERADAIMLAGETAVGRHAVRAVQTLDAIIRHAEGALEPAQPAPRVDRSDHKLAVCEAAVALAGRAGAAAIVALTEAGTTARTLAALRPAAAVIAATEHAAIANRLSLTWGVQTVVTATATVDAVRGLLAARNLVRPGSVVVFVSVEEGLGRADANFVHVERVSI